MGQGQGAGQVWARPRYHRSATCSSEARSNESSGCVLNLPDTPALSSAVASAMRLDGQRHRQARIRPGAERRCDRSPESKP